jgi:hypothetical protein
MSIIVLGSFREGLPGSVVDPDPHGSASICLSWIRICVWNADPDPGASKLTKFFTNKIVFSAFQKGFCTFVCMFYDLF